MWRDVDLIAYVPIQFRSQRIGDTPRSGSTFLCGRSPAVFTEGADPSLLDWGRASEACEIGGLGTPGPRSVWTGPPAGVDLLGPCGAEGRRRLGRSVTNSGRGMGASPSTRCLVRPQRPCA